MPQHAKHPLWRLFAVVTLFIIVIQVVLWVSFRFTKSFVLGAAAVVGSIVHEPGKTG